MSRRLVATLSALGLLTTASVFSAQAQTTSPAVPVRDGLPMAEMGKLIGDAFQVDAPPAGQTPEQRADWLLRQRPMLGRTPAAWLDFANTGFDVESPAIAPLRVADLTAEVLRTYSLVGLNPPATEPAHLAAQVAALPPIVRTELASLVATVNDAYAAQAPLADTVITRFNAGFDPTKPLLSQAERDATAARQQSIVAALARFRAIALPAIPVVAVPADAPLFSDFEGLVVVGGTGNSTHNRGGNIQDPVLMIDPAGSDIYNNSAGGACPVTPNVLAGKWLQCNSLVLSVVADLGDGVTAASNDQYNYNGEPAAVQGAGGPGGIGVLVDVGGNDRYSATMTRTGAGPFQPLLYYFDGGAQGYGYAGSGLMLDASGDDYYYFATKSTQGRSIWSFAQGFGGAGGLGIATDSSGSDQWITPGLGITGGNGGFQGVYTQGVGIYGGVGVITDAGITRDVYSGVLTSTTTDYYSQGFGAFGGLGMQSDAGGNDSYTATQTASSSWINPLLNCAFGTGSYAGVGIFLEAGGNDTYYGASTATNGGGATIDDFGAGHPGVSYGLFVDAGGADRYEMKATSAGGGYTHTAGMGFWEPGFGNILDAPVGHNTFGTFLDAGGATDTYIGAPWATNNSQWAFGADR